MSKRFTDTEKWEDPWFRNLLREYQIFWIYLLDKCDSAGVWKVDFELAEFCLKQSLNEKELSTVFKNRIKIFENGERWFIPKFITFQYGNLDETCHPHKSIFKLLRSYKLEGYLEGINTPNTRTRQDNTRQDKGLKKCFDENCGQMIAEKEFTKHMTEHTIQRHKVRELK